MHCRLDIDIQLVTSHVGGFDNVRVKASLFQLDEAHPHGCLEVLPAVEVEVKDKDHWISLDANTKRSHAEAGTGGLALVRASQYCLIIMEAKHADHKVCAHMLAADRKRMKYQSCYALAD